MDVNVKNKVIIITGAGGGIGRATALRFAASGARVVATDLDKTVAQATADAIEAAGGEALAIAHDVSSEAAWLDVVRRAQERFGGVDVLVNNAGIFIIAPIEATTLDQRARSRPAHPSIKPTQTDSWPLWSARIRLSARPRAPAPG